MQRSGEKRNFAISQINVMPPKPPQSDVPKLSKIDTVYVVMLNIALGAGILGVIQSDSAKDWLSKYYSQPLLKRYLNQNIRDRVSLSDKTEDAPKVEEITQLKKKKGSAGLDTMVASTSRALGPFDTSKPHTNPGEILVITSIEGCGISTALFEEACANYEREDKKKNGVIWIDGRTVGNSFSSSLVTSISNSSSNMLRSETIGMQLSNILKEYCDGKKTGDKESEAGLVVVVDHPSSISQTTMTVFKDFLSEIALLTESHHVRLVLVDPSPEVCRAAFQQSFVSNEKRKPRSIHVLNARGYPLSDLKDFLVEEQFKTGNAAELASRIINICGPDLRCIQKTSFEVKSASNLAPNKTEDIHLGSTTLKRRLTRCANQTKTTVLSALDPRAQLAQLGVLDYLAGMSEGTTMVTSPPELISISALRASNYQYFARILLKKPKSNGDDLTHTVRFIADQALDQAFQQFEKDDVLWRCTAVGAAVPNSSATHVALKRRATPVVWKEMLTHEPWVDATKEAALTAARKLI